MSLYNMVFGYSQLAAPLLAALNIDPRNVPRFRDCFLNKDGSAIVIFTRTGGGNREEYAEQNDAMTRWPGYLSNHDDETDSTYAHFNFAVPEEIKDNVVTAIANGHGVDIAERWKQAFAALEKGPR